MAGTACVASKTRPVRERSTARVDIPWCRWTEACVNRVQQPIGSTGLEVALRMGRRTNENRYT